MARQKGIPESDIVAIQRDVLPSYLFVYINAFMALSTCRVNSQVVGSIPWTSINDYCNRYDILEFELFFDMISAMDDVFISEMNKKTGK